LYVKLLLFFQKQEEIRGNTTTEHETKNTFSELKQGVGDLSKENKQQVRDTFFTYYNFFLNIKLKVVC
jgi:hypothetical protein